MNNNHYNQSTNTTTTDLVWVQNPIYNPDTPNNPNNLNNPQTPQAPQAPQTPQAPQKPQETQNPQTPKQQLPEYVEQVLIEAKARFPKLTMSEKVYVDIPEFICYEPYIF